MGAICSGPRRHRRHRRLPSYLEEDVFEYSPIIQRKRSDVIQRSSHHQRGGGAKRHHGNRIFSSLIRASCSKARRGEASHKPTRIRYKLAKHRESREVMYIFKFDEEGDDENNAGVETATTLGAGFDTSMKDSTKSFEKTMAKDNTDKTTRFSAKTDKTIVAPTQDGAKSGNHVAKRDVTHIYDNIMAPDSPRFNKMTRHRAQSEGGAADSAKREIPVDGIKTRRPHSAKYPRNNSKSGRLHRTKSQVM